MGRTFDYEPKVKKRRRRWVWRHLAELYGLRRIQSGQWVACRAGVPYIVEREAHPDPDRWGRYEPWKVDAVLGERGLYRVGLAKNLMDVCAIIEEHYLALGAATFWSEPPRAT